MLLHVFCRSALTYLPAPDVYRRIQSSMYIYIYTHSAPDHPLQRNKEKRDLYLDTDPRPIKNKPRNISKPLGGRTPPPPDHPPTPHYDIV